MQEIVERRREIAPSLLPEGLFQQGEGDEERGDIPSSVGEDLLFQLRERGLVGQSPDPALEGTRRGQRSIPTWTH